MEEFRNPGATDVHYFGTSVAFRAFFATDVLKKWTSVA